MAESFDVVVVGGGAAGLSGALALARARRSVLVVDGGEPRNAPAGQVHNYLAREGTPPAELLAVGRDEVRGYGGEVRAGFVVAVHRDDRDGEPAFTAELRDGRTVRARRLLLATGLVDRLPAVPGVAERWGRDVLHCPYCHGWEVRDEPLVVLGTGPLGVHQALLWRQWSDDVVLVQHGGAAPGADEREQLDARGVRLLNGPALAVEVDDDAVTGVRLASGAGVPCRAVVVAPRFDARDDLLADLGLATELLTAGDHVIGSAVAADGTGATATPGVWVAGNASDAKAQVLTAAAQGLAAGAAINGDLVAEDTRRAVAALARV